MNIKHPELISAIDVGSNYIRMSIAEASPGGSISILEDLTQVTNIGRDAFSTGRISVETIKGTAETLKGFSRLMKDYRVKKYRAVSTTGIREAENQEYILEQIRLKTGLDIEVINSAQERFFMYKALRRALPGTELLSVEPTLIVNITSGGIETSIYESGNLLFTVHIKLGSLRLRELLSGLEGATIDFPDIMEEYIESKIYFLKPIIKERKIKYFVGLGGELSTIYELCYGSTFTASDNLFIQRQKLVEFHDEIMEMSSDQVISKYKISSNREDILLPSVIFFNSFIRLTEAEGIHAPMISLRHGILYSMADELFMSLGRKDSYNDIISSVWYIASKYGVVKSHADYVEDLSLSIFDQTCRLHGLGERERLYLQVAAILHDSGNYVSFSMHEVHSYNIIRTQSIMGFSNKELNIIANIARYHDEDIPERSHENYEALSFKEKIIVSKLAAILRLGESLDVSHSQKIRNLVISISGSRLVFRVSSSENILLEEWDFNNNAGFYEEVMGLRPILKSKG